jgi:hypothetical protein
MCVSLPSTWHYHLADEICPRWRIFITSITDPRTVNEAAFSRQQEAVRKGVERVFGVLFQQIQILHRPCRLWHMKPMRSVVLACVVVHNMVVLERKHRYTGARVAELGGRELPSGVVRINKAPQTEAEHVHLWRTVAVPVESRADHQRLKDALMGYIWERKGEAAGNGSMSDGDEFVGRKTSKTAAVYKQAGSSGGY